MTFKFLYISYVCPSKGLIHLIILFINENKWCVHNFVHRNYKIIFKLTHIFRRDGWDEQYKENVNEKEKNIVQRYSWTMGIDLVRR